MKIAGYETHPAADLFPMYGEAELKALAADILKNGQEDPIIVTSENLVLDGRNRLAACELAGVEPDVQMWAREDDDVSPVDWVLSKNLHRRHLNSSQAALVAIEAVPLYKLEAERRQKRGVSAPGREGGKATEKAAAAAGVGGRTVERAQWVADNAPKELVDQIRAGEVTLKQAEKQLRHKQRVAEVKAYRPPEGEYPVITVDPPWKYDDELDGSDQVRGGITYPPMEIAEIAAIKLPVAEDCAVFLWVTNSHLIDPDGYPVVARAWRERYGLVPKQIRTWRKVTLDGTKERLSGGHVWRNNTEHLVRLERGKPVYNKVTQPTFFEAPRSPVHSEKPNMAYEDILALCPAQPRLEMFSRKPRNGWVTVGSEVQAAEKKKRKPKMWIDPNKEMGP